MGLDVYGELYLGVPVPREKLYMDGEKVLRCRSCGNEQPKGKRCIECGYFLENAHRQLSTHLHIAIQHSETLSMMAIADQEDRNPERFFVGIRLSGTNSTRFTNAPHEFIDLDYLEGSRAAIQPELDKLGLGKATLMSFVRMSY